MVKHHNSGPKVKTLSAPLKIQCCSGNHFRKRKIRTIEKKTRSVCNFQSMKSPMELKCLLWKFFLIKIYHVSLGKPIDSHCFKMSCLTCLVFSCVYCFFLKTIKLHKYICSAWISRTSVEFFFLTDWCHKRLKNTIDLLLFYRELFYGFSESVVVISGD